MIGALVGEGFTFAEIEAMTLPQVAFAANGGKASRSAEKWDSFEDFALWRGSL